ncbi:MAG: hypoxanthine phosphoribosyltransferase [Deltaproteobacteria bacterium]|nr:hypoxanthine phosphoribosyltransferase [Deltaproteobacteria bacterium]MBW1718290.1 hypoxanthine phosphoribosyltransferase [Deltaproteobacteria bacterium]MBW1932081.1 hypoxanthine phosphoribosyltransferase [Deltaproteobacteria bacterium]MBW1938916.1 hypoxanthine phosphoribosyltransferase [Deltaproteobacteria bacterium]MBW1963620.1 hypoxanthine phosphoribosyltransferase [Deltaproteobacteria bacterium]
MNNKDQLREVLSSEIIKVRVHELGEQISKDYHGRPLVLIGILNGAFIFMADLIRNIQNSMQIDFVRLASYGSQAESSGRISITKDIELDIKDKEVLVVEDIVDTGYTLKYLKEVLKLHNPASVRICCLIDKKERRKVPIEVDYVGFDIPRGFLVGYGLDFDENYRSLPGVYHLNPVYKPEGFVPSDR